MNPPSQWWRCIVKHADGKESGWAGHGGPIFALTRAMFSVAPGEEVWITMTQIPDPNGTGDLGED